ncbi:MAG: hypothetical protein R2748_19725 [Bryobacterales bacterium]
MPLADNCGLVAGFLQQLDEGLLLAVEDVQVCGDGIEVAVFARQDDGAAWCTDRVGDQRRPEQHALACQAVDVRRVVEPVSIGGQRLVGVVSEDEDDVRTLGGEEAAARENRAEKSRD